MPDEESELHAREIMSVYVDDSSKSPVSMRAGGSFVVPVQRRRQRVPLLILFTVLLNASCAFSQTVNVDVSMANQTFEGWGTSLAWFANSAGGWSDTTTQGNLMQTLFSPSNGLGLNYLRYNIGGG